MKKLLLIAAACLVLSGCKKDSDGRLDPNATVALNPAPGVKAAAEDAGNPAHLTARQIVEQANAILAKEWDNVGIDDWNRDLENNRIIGSSTWVVAQNGTLETFLISASDLILVTFDRENHPVDTIAYIPNSIMRDTEKQIAAAYEAADYATCYRLFEEGFVFTPITGAEWLELKAEGKN